MHLVRIAHNGWRVTAAVDRRGHCQSELKTPRGWRLFYFFLPGRLVVCTELKAKPKSRELAEIVGRSQRLREACVAAMAAGRLEIDVEG